MTLIPCPWINLQEKVRDFMAVKIREKPKGFVSYKVGLAHPNVLIRQLELARILPVIRRIAFSAIVNAEISFPRRGKFMISDCADSRMKQ